MKSLPLEFSNAVGEKLSGRLDLPENPAAYALFAHCFTCNKNFKAVTHISRALTERNIAVFRFDFTGLGESEGDFADTNFSSNVEDLAQAARFLAEEYEAPEILIGHSLGGAAVLKVAASVPEAKAVATIGAPFDPAHVTGLLQSSREEIEQTGEAVVLLAGRPFKIKKQFLEDLESTSLTLAELKQALLVMHSPIDKIVGVQNAASIFQAAKHPKSFISLDAADHLLSNEADSRYAGAMVAQWAARFVTTDIDSKPEPNEADAKKGHNKNHQVNVTIADGYKTLVTTPDHQMIVDEPESLGGTNLGANPYEYLLASLGGCTAITLRMYSERKGWPLESVEIGLDFDRIHFKDCETCDADLATSPEAKIERITRSIRLVGDLDAEQRASLLKIADKCPVHRTLKAKMHIETVAV